MTGKDTAGDKLIASIQKTKAQAAGTDEKPVENQANPVAKKATTKKAVAKKTVAKKAVSKKAAKPKASTAAKSTRSAQSNKKELVRTFQHGRRVWPD